MQLSFETIQTLALGAAYFTEENGLKFHRFTREQEELYCRYHPALSHKTVTTAGISLEFETDATAVALDVDVKAVLTRTYFSFDLFVDNVYRESLSNVPRGIQNVEVPYPMGRFQKTFLLPGGRKQVKLLFPWSVDVTLHSLTLQGASYLLPVKKKRKILFLGDSITHGYDAFPAWRSYASQITARLDGEGRNNAVSAECFFPELVEQKQGFSPDIILVAYGTNDWEMRTVSDFEKNCRCFFRNLTASYPDTPIFALTPIWRKDYATFPGKGPFAYIQQFIEQTAKAYPNVTVLPAFDFVPHDPGCYGDFRLHPNAGGFDHYAERLYERLAPYL